MGGGGNLFSEPHSHTIETKETSDTFVLKAPYTLKEKHAHTHTSLIVICLANVIVSKSVSV